MVVFFILRLLLVILLGNIFSRVIQNRGVGMEDLRDVLLIIVINMLIGTHLINESVESINQSFNTNLEQTNSESVVMMGIEGEHSPRELVEDIDKIIDYNWVDNRNLVIDIATIEVDEFGQCDDDNSYVTRYTIDSDTISKFNITNLLGVRGESHSEVLDRILKLSDSQKITSREYVKTYNENFNN